MFDGGRNIHINAHMEKLFATLECNVDSMSNFQILELLEITTVIYLIAVTCNQLWKGRKKPKLHGTFVAY